ncbi:uncharacterized protein LOC135095282 isoform X2 [Scylla paramamosain]|uniref:uncharacterized protein LOC135095282 isoform X2 n=1 Tax=Scylla paramamosain TaxID=85552 RepID=UPI0030829024
MTGEAMWKTRVVFVTVFRAQQVEETTMKITEILTKFAHLTPGKKYTLEVKECFTTVHCDILTTLEEWTEPEKPRVLEKTELQTTTDTTITIQLPVLQNPPRSV